MKENIKTASKLSNQCQRNWDHSKSIDQEDIEVLLETVKNSPTKQNETHYKVYYTDDEDLIYKVYKKTKKFTVIDSFEHTNNDGYTKSEYEVTNSQVNANLLFAFCDDWNQSFARSATHAIVDARGEDKVNPRNLIIREQQKHYSMGIAIGELILAANLLGYRTGICSAFGKNDMRVLFNDSLVEILVGIGIPHPKKDRREHEEVYNKDILTKSRRTGADDEKWLFPSFKKKLTIEKI
tara:strand:+ start:5568 stop:6281 length:714 start_codon:yes stop_codon:yes gene_type:complete